MLFSARNPFSTPFFAARSTVSPAESVAPKNVRVLSSCARLLRQKRSVLNGGDAGAHGQLDSFGAVRMRGHLAYQFIRLVDQRLQLSKLY